MTEAIELPASGDDGALWCALCELANSFTGEWTIIGARMVELHALEHGRVPPRASDDADTLTNARSIGSRPQDLSGWLQAHGWAHDGSDREGVGHRFRRNSASIDVLAPDHLGTHADLTTVAPARTVEVPGGTRALRQTSHCAVQCGDVRADLPRPHLPGALVLKARAVEVDDTPESQRVDFGFLCSLVGDVEAVREALDTKERGYLARRKELQNPAHRAWRELGPRAADAHAAYMRLSTP